MSATYPKPETPLPWHYGMTLVTADCDYVLRAANAFPHLVAALEAMLRDDPFCIASGGARHALAIARRGETTP